ncbi:MAG: M28 family peptidase, partial [Bacteroidota bacterium]
GVKKIFPLLLIFLAFNPVQSQSSEEEDAFFIKSIFQTVLQDGQAYEWLRYLCKDVGPRLAGSPGAEAAVISMQRLMDTLGFDTVYLQPCIAPRWVRGKDAQARIINSRQVGTQELRVTTLGNTIGTGPAGITAPVVEVRSFDELDELGEQTVAGKIVFFNRPMPSEILNTFSAYGAAVEQRVYGAIRAGRLGAVGVIVRSMTTEKDDVPHTGTSAYEDETLPIPAISISTNDADMLSRLLLKEELSIHFESHGKMLTDVGTYNVIGEIKGSSHPEEIILVGGHLDSWDLGEGAHDDGAGCVQAIQVLPLLSQLGYRPKRTFRCVLFMNEENGLAGGRAYWAASNAKDEFHLLAIESDRGGFTPRGFSAQAEDAVFTAYYRQLNKWLPLLEPYGLSFSSGGSGADISGLKSQNGLLIGLVPDSQRYFDYHHTAADVFEAVNRRELHLGAAAMASLVYLIDNYGLR